MAATTYIYQVRNADNTSTLQPERVDYPHTEAGLGEELEEARRRSFTGTPQVVLDVSETVMDRFKDGASPG